MESIGDFGRRRKTLRISGPLPPTPHSRAGRVKAAEKQQVKGAGNSVTKKPTAKLKPKG